MLRQRLKEARKAKNLKQQTMANSLGMTLGNYQKYEYGGANPTLEKLVKIADILDVSTDYLLCRDEFIRRHHQEEE